MRKFDPTWQDKKSQGVALLLSLLILITFAIFVLFLQSSFKQRENLEATQHYLTFENRVKQLIHTNVVMLKSFDAFLRITSDLNQDKTYQYLDYLLEGSFEMIRNIGLIQDSTPIWNYPRATNADAIGVDLSMIIEQKDVMLKIKDEKNIFVHGPFDLVQGGCGISIRVPVLYDNGDYWGQATIVLKEDEFIEEIASYATDLNLKLAIFNREDADKPFFSNIGKEKRFLDFKLAPDITSWSVRIGYGTGITGHMFLIYSLTVILLLSVAIGIAIFQYLRTGYRILNISIHDHLTGLYNRHFLDEYQELTLAAAKRQNQQVGLIMIDLNQFKAINDTYGHKVGDLVLSEVGRILQKFTRSGEAAFRLGGDEFLIILPNVVDPQSLTGAKNRFHNVFSTAFNLPGYAIKPTMSIGTALYPSDGDNFSSLLQIADQRLYQEKSAGTHPISN